MRPLDKQDCYELDYRHTNRQGRRFKRPSPRTAPLVGKIKNAHVEPAYQYSHYYGEMRFVGRMYA